MPLEPNIYALWWGAQTVKGTENTTPPHRGIQVGGDFSIARDEGTEDWSDMSKYGAQTQWINSLVGNGNPALEATPSELANLLWAAHGGEVVTAGTNNVWTLGGSPTSGTFDLRIYDGTNFITVTGVVNTVTAAALATSINSAMTTAGHTGTPVATGGGPLNSTPITITFSGTTTAARPWYLSKANDTTSPAVTVTNTTPGVRTKHTFTPSLTQGKWMTFCKRIGTTVIQRQSFIDCLIGGFTLEASTANKAMRFTPTILSLDPGKVLASDPTAVLPGTPQAIDGRPFQYTDATGAFTFNGVTFQAQSEFTFTVNEDRSPVYGDDAVPYDLVVGNPSAALSISAIFDAVTYARWNELVYGTASPTAGTKPLRTVPANSAYTCNFQQKNADGSLSGNRLVGNFPAVHWAMPDAPGPNPGGGAVNVTFGGTLLPPGGTATPYTLDVYNGDTAAYTV